MILHKSSKETLNHFKTEQNCVNSKCIKAVKLLKNIAKFGKLHKTNVILAKSCKNNTKRANLLKTVVYILGNNVENEKKP